MGGEIVVARETYQRKGTPLAVGGTTGWRMSDRRDGRSCTIELVRANVCADEWDEA